MIARLFAALLVCMPLLAGARPPAGPSVEAWTASADANGFRIEQGQVVVQDAATCQHMIDIFSTCWGNNPAAPYILLMPPVDGTYVDPTYAAPFTQTLASGVSTNYFYRLADTDALVTVIDLPPPAAYFGFNSYLFTRPLLAYPELTDPKNLSPDVARLALFASVNDAINQEVIENETGATLGSGKTVVVISSVNPQLVKSIRKSLGDYGLDKQYAVVEKLRSNLRPGIDADADDFITLLRYAMPVSDSSAQQWLDDVGQHVQVYRVSRTDIPADRYGDVTLARKQDGNEQGLQSSTDELVGILTRWLSTMPGKLPVRFTMLSTASVDEKGRPTGLVGPQCIAEGSNCLGDSQDTDSYRFMTVGELAPADTAIVVGANHVALDNARYVSVGVYNGSSLNGIAEASQSQTRGTLDGSAERVLTGLGLMAEASPTLQRDLPLLYVTMISRSCALNTTDCIELDAATLPPDAPMLLTQRAYLKPGTGTGANPESLVPPVVITRAANPF